MSVPSYSQGSRGLSVLPRVNGIFTANSISLSPWSRQWGSRYAIRAGRNLPAKEFRYLRTVIVTAAVYWGFGSQLHPEGLTAPLNLPAPGRRQTLYVLSLEFAESCVFGKQSLPPALCNFVGPRAARAVNLLKAHLLPKLRCQFAEFLNQGYLKRLGILYQPTCVGLRYGHQTR